MPRAPRRTSTIPVMDDNALTALEVADRLGLTRGGVWQVEQKAIRKLWQQGAQLRRRLLVFEELGVFDA